MNHSNSIDNSSSKTGDGRPARDVPLARRLIERTARAVAVSITQSAQTGDRWPPSRSRPLGQATRRWFAAYRRGPVRAIPDDESPVSAHRKIWLDGVSR